MIIQLIRFEYDKHQYRVMSNSNNYGDMEVYVEQYQYNDNKEKPVWIKLSKDLIDGKILTMIQLTEILSIVSSYVSENFYLVVPVRGGRCVEPGE